MLRRNAIFLSLWLVTVVSLTIALCVVDKGELHLSLCDHHTAWGDVLMPVLSDTCNWLPYMLAAGLLIWRWRIGLFMTGSLLLSTAIVQPIKHLVGAPRPLTWFAQNMPDISLPLTEGVNMHYYLSFPSGHTTTFFCLYFALCAIYTYYAQQTPTAKPWARKWVCILVQVVCFLLAAISSYSRLYLSQHFALDVLAGMVIGVASVLIMALIFNRACRRSCSTAESCGRTPQA